MTDTPTSKPRSITKTHCKRVIGAVQDLGIEDFDIVIEGAAMRIVVRKDVAESGNDMGNLIDGIV